jgi:2-dehydro-3-deoxyphosphooctonate aldolase (KDO 8-P synthase)
LFVIAGPCVVENESLCLSVAERMQQITSKLGLPYIFKASYDTANRTSGASFRGPGMDEGLRILERVRDAIGVPVLSDVHGVEDVSAAADVLDVLQIPAFLCRQTDLLLAAGRTNKTVNVKKGQFLAPWDMRHAVEKIASVENHRILLTERGACFGYNNLVSDFRSLPIMRQWGYPVVFDATHSVSASSSPRWPAPRSRSGATASSWKCIPIRITRRRTGRIWCRWIGSKSCFDRSRASAKRSPTRTNTRDDSRPGPTSP